MRINEYNSLEEFTSQYVGEWAPSEGHWFGLDFSYSGNEYRLNTGSMYNPDDTVLSDGRTALYSLYIKTNEIQNGIPSYKLLGEYADIQDLLDSTVINGIPFGSVIMDDKTELLGQD